MLIDKVIAECPRTARSENFDKVLRKLHEIFEDFPINIVETGCARQLNDSGDGYSTLVFSRYVDACHGFLWTVDISEVNIGICAEILKRNSGEENVSLIVMDSVKFLEGFDSPIHFLYLDSYDTDLKKFCAVHQVNEAKAALDKMSENSLILIDDVYQREGKAEFSVPFLKANGFREVWYQNNQILLEKISE